MFQSSLDALGNIKLAPLTSMSAVKASNLKAVGKSEVAVPEAVENDKARLEGAVRKLNEYVAPALQTIQFSIDQESERIVVKVVDTTTQEVLRQIPNEEVLAITRTLDKLQGLVIRQTA
jgi:flagellar protein FlaG